MLQPVFDCHLQLKTSQMMPRKRNDLTLAQQMKVIKMLEAVPRISQSIIAKHFMVSQSQISRIGTNRVEIRKEWESNNNPTQKRRRFINKDTDIEKALLCWYNFAVTHKLPISDDILKGKSVCFAERFGIANFLPSIGWLRRWKEKNGIQLASEGLEMNPVLNTVDEQMESLIQTILSLYRPCDVYACQETGLYFKYLPEAKGYIKSEVLTQRPPAMERLTILFAANLTGTDKQVPVVIGKQEKPSDFAPLPYYYNRSCWMTAEAFGHWLTQWDVQLQNSSRKILLLLEDSPAHSRNLQLQNIRLIFLSSKVSTPKQPFSLGIIHNFKAIYRQHMMQRVVSLVGNYDQLEDSTHTGMVSILDALYLIKASWDCISSDIIIYCFNKAGLSSTQLVKDVNLNVVPPVGMSERDFQAFISVDDNLPCTGVPSDEDICQSVLEEHEGSTVIVDGMIVPESEVQSIPGFSAKIPSPSTQQVVAACEILRLWLQTQGTEHYNAFHLLESEIHSKVLQSRQDQRSSDENLKIL